MYLQHPSRAVVIHYALYMYFVDLQLYTINMKHILALILDDWSYIFAYSAHIRVNVSLVSLKVYYQTLYTTFIEPLYSFGWTQSNKFCQILFFLYLFEHLSGVTVRHNELYSLVSVPHNRSHVRVFPQQW